MTLFNSKWSSVSLALVAIILSSSAASSAQFNIKLPKIPKVTKEKEQPKPTSSSAGDPVSASVPASAPNASSLRGSDVQNGRAVDGKVFFSTTPFTNSSAGAKSSFTSQEFIYGRLELNRSISETFGLGNMPKRDYYFLKYVVFIGNEQKSIGPHTGNHLYLSKEDVSKTFLNFDVLPDPNNVNTVLSVVDELWNYKFPAALASKHDIRSKFPQNGEYPIRVVLFQANFDDYGEPKFDDNPLPYAAGQFTFQFAARDAQAISDNYDKSVDSAQTANNKRNTVKALPAWWGKNRGPADAKLSVARLTAFFNGRASRNDAVYLNKFAWQSHSGAVWTIFKDQYGLPSYRYSPFVWAIYKNNRDGLCYYGWHSVREDYSGAGTYGQAYLSPIRDETYIDCTAVR